MLLFCSDGLNKVVSPGEIVKILEPEIPLDQKANHLITRGSKNGGPHNISTILVEISPVESVG